jgi:predicted Zn-dependent protease with MMP-like domain
MTGRYTSESGQTVLVLTDLEHFESLVADAVDQIPEELGRLMENVGIFVEDWPTPEQLRGRTDITLLGLYEGIALTNRSALTYGGAMPDKITIFRGPISRMAHNEEQLARIVTRTVIHEVAHHFGISDERLEELGYA